LKLTHVSGGIEVQTTITTSSLTIRHFSRVSWDLWTRLRLKLNHTKFCIK